MKIHVSSLSDSTVSHLESAAHDLIQVGSTVTLTGHATKRARDKHITEGEVLACIMEGSLVEVIIKWFGPTRVLLRNVDGVCCVVEMETGTVITVYRNEPRDEHRTLDTSQYAFYGRRVELSDLP